MLEKGVFLQDPPLRLMGMKFERDPTLAGEKQLLMDKNVAPLTFQVALRISAGFRHRAIPSHFFCILSGSFFSGNSIGSSGPPGN